MKTYDTNISYKEKYFSFDTEKRIRRMQFLWRMLSFPILVALISAVSMYLTFFIGMSISWEGTPISIAIMIGIPIIGNILVGAFFIFSVPRIVQKRHHDFGQEGKVLAVIISGIGLLNTIIALCSLLFGLFNTTDWILHPPLVFQILGLIANILSYVYIVLFLYLLFRPGTKGTNEYGEDTYYKAGLLG